MNEQQSNPNRKKITGAVVTLAAALAAPALTACTGTADRPQNPSPAATAMEDPAVKAEREQREAFLQKFDAIPAPVEVIANPLVVTSEAKQRERVLHSISDEDLSIAWGNPPQAIKNAKRAIANASDPDVRRDGRLYLSQELAQNAVDSASGDVFVYDNSERSRRENARTITLIRKELDAISSDKIRATATDLVNRTLVNEALDDEDGKLSKTEAALLERVPKSLRAKAMQMLKDKTGESHEKFEQELTDDEEQLDAQNKGFFSLYDGAAYRAPEINEVMKAQLQDRKEHVGDDKRPGAKDIAMEAVMFNDPEDASLQRGNVLAIPEEFAEVKQEALRAYDGRLLNEISDELEYSSSLDTLKNAQDTLDTVKAYLGLFIDDANKKLAEELVEVRLAVLYTELSSEYDVDGKKDEKARDQLVLMQLPDSSKAKKEALKIRGGKFDTSKLAAMSDDVESRAYSLFEKAEEELDNGSNSRAEGVNEQVADYLKANNE